MTTRERTLEEIAQRVLDMPTLDTRRSDDLDFHDLAVWSIKEALERAYDAGWASRPPATAPCPRCGAEVSIHPIP